MDELSNRLISNNRVPEHPLSVKLDYMEITNNIDKDKGLLKVGKFVEDEPKKEIYKCGTIYGNNRKEETKKRRRIKSNLEIGENEARNFLESRFSKIVKEETNRHYDVWNNGKKYSSKSDLINISCDANMDQSKKHLSRGKRKIIRREKLRISNERIDQEKYSCHKMYSTIDDDEDIRGCYKYSDFEGTNGNVIVTPATKEEKKEKHTSEVRITADDLRSSSIGGLSFSCPGDDSRGTSTNIEGEYNHRNGEEKSVGQENQDACYELLSALLFLLKSSKVSPSPDSFLFLSPLKLPASCMSIYDSVGSLINHIEPTSASLNTVNCKTNISLAGQKYEEAIKTLPLSLDIPIIKASVNFPGGTAQDVCSQPTQSSFIRTQSTPNTGRQASDTLRGALTNISAVTNNTRCSHLFTGNSRSMVENDFFQHHNNMQCKCVSTWQCECRQNEKMATFGGLRPVLPKSSIISGKLFPVCHIKRFSETEQKQKKCNVQHCYVDNPSKLIVEPRCIATGGKDTALRQNSNTRWLQSYNNYALCSGKLPTNMVNNSQTYGISTVTCSQISQNCLDFDRKLYIEPCFCENSHSILCGEKDNIKRLSSFESFATESTSTSSQNDCQKDKCYSSSFQDGSNTTQNLDTPYCLCDYCYRSSCMDYERGPSCLMQLSKCGHLDTCTCNYNRHFKEILKANYFDQCKADKKGMVNINPRTHKWNEEYHVCNNDSPMAHNRNKLFVSKNLLNKEKSDHSHVEQFDSANIFTYGRCTLNKDSPYSKADVTANSWNNLDEISRKNFGNAYINQEMKNCGNTSIVLNVPHGNIQGFRTKSHPVGWMCNCGNFICEQKEEKQKMQHIECKMQNNYCVKQSIGNQIQQRITNLKPIIDNRKQHILKHELHHNIAPELISNVVMNIVSNAAPVSLNVDSNAGSKTISTFNSSLGCCKMRCAAPPVTNNDVSSPVLNASYKMPLNGMKGCHPTCSTGSIRDKRGFEISDRNEKWLHSRCPICTPDNYSMEVSKDDDFHGEDAKLVYSTSNSLISDIPNPLLMPLDYREQLETTKMTNLVPSIRNCATESLIISQKLNDCCSNESDFFLNNNHMSSTFLRTSGTQASSVSGVSIPGSSSVASSLSTMMTTGICQISSTTTSLSSSFLSSSSIAVRMKSPCITSATSVLPYSVSNLTLQSTSSTSFCPTSDASNSADNSAAAKTKSVTFKSGIRGVVWDSNLRSWVASWCDNSGKRIRRHFLSKVYGFEKAKILAVRCRAEAENSGQANLPRPSSSGVRGVKWYGGAQVWVAYWQVNRKQCHKWFSVKKYGYSQALQKAILYRKSMETKYYSQICNPTNNMSE